jgi:hypothetical protein
MIKLLTMRVRQGVLLRRHGLASWPSEKEVFADMAPRMAAKVFEQCRMESHVDLSDRTWVYSMSTHIGSLHEFEGALLYAYRLGYRAAVDKKPESPNEALEQVEITTKEYE